MKNNTAPIRLLLLNDSSNDAEYVLNILRKGGFATRPKLIEFGTEFKDAINQQIWDLILTTTMVGNTSATLILDILNRMDLDIPTIILTHESSEEETTKFLRDGAKDVVLLERNRHLLFVIQRELDNLSERRTRRRHEISIREFQRRTKGLLETLQDAVAYVLDGMHIHVNPVYLKLFGFKKMEELESVPIMDLIVPENQADFKTFLQGLRNHQEQKIKSIELVGLGPHGKFNVKMEFSPAIFEGEECHQVVTRDLSHWVDINKLNLIAQQDNLTALYSHQYFLQALDEAVTAAVEEEQRGFLIYLEIDNFRTIKETVGVAASDEIIKDIADILRDKISTGQILARFADATFTLLSKGNDIEPVREFAETLRKAMLEHILEANSQSITTTCSIGISPFTGVTSNAHEVLTRAANTCHQVMKNGGNRVAIYERIIATDEDLLDSGALAEEIALALSESRISLQYQPIVSLHGETMENYEAMVFLALSNGRKLTSDEIFQIEETGDIASQVDQWIVDRILQKLILNRDQGQSARLFIRLSEQAIMDESMILDLAKQLKSERLGGDNLIFELSETSANTRVKQAKAFVNGLKQLHCKTVLSNFGSGLDSFKLLKHVTVDFVKLDSSFIHGLIESQENQRAVMEINNKAQSMGIKTIAPNVVDANSLAILWQCGIKYAQGDYIQAPNSEMSYDFKSEG